MASLARASGSLLRARGCFTQRMSFCRPVAAMGIATINPATGEKVKEFEELTSEQLESKLSAAMDAYKTQRRIPLKELSDKMRRAGEILEEEADSFAKIMTLEMGKTLSAAKAEALKCAKVCHYYSEKTEQLLAPQEVPTDEGVVNRIHYQPLGAVLAVMPWNFPFWQVFRFAAPAIMARNVALLKHASNVPQCALAIEDVFTRAGFPTGTFQTLLIGSSKVNALLEDPRVAAVTVTGSVSVGGKVASKAAEHIKKSVLELGGSDPFIIMPSADLDKAVPLAVKARVQNNGQSCIAAKRFIVHEAIYDKFVDKFVAGFEALRVGDPMKEDTDVGPLSQEQGRKDIEEQVDQSVKAGAKVLVGGKRLPGKGWFYAPTILADIPKDAPAYRDEIFGPVASVFKVRSAEEAVELANDTVFGLGAAAWTHDAKETQLFVENIESGFLAINDMVASDPRLPFGGVKQSGYGRELGPLGIKEFTNAKTVSIKDAGRMNGKV